MNASVKIETFIFNVRYILEYFNNNKDYAQERDKYLIFESEKKIMYILCIENLSTTINIKLYIYAVFYSILAYLKSDCIKIKI